MTEEQLQELTEIAADYIHEHSDVISIDEIALKDSLRSLLSEIV